MEATKRFFVGVGVQKAATTWLWTYLMSHPEVMFSPIKELHFFDSKYTYVHAGAIRAYPRIRRNLRSFRQSFHHDPVRTMSMFRDYLGMLAYNEDAYRRFLDRYRSGDRISGEFTPDYVVLGEDGVAAIERVLEGPLYLLVVRNPADRFWSHVRYRSRWTGDLRRTEDAVGLLRQETYWLRSSFSRFHKILERFVERERIHVTFYENLFAPERNQAECDRICRFLSISDHPANSNERVNVGDDVPDEKFDRLSIIRMLKQDYDFYEERFGADLPQSWKDDLERLRANQRAFTRPEP